MESLMGLEPTVIRLGNEALILSGDSDKMVIPDRIELSSTRLEGECLFR